MNDPSDFIVTHADKVPSGARVLDVAAGSGRHSRFFLARGCMVMAVDLNTGGLSDLMGTEGFAVLEADLENGPWPLGNAQFDAVVVTNYLWRPLFAALTGAVAAGGLIFYETFGEGNAAFGKPSNPDYLLKDGELAEIFSDFQVLDYWHGQVEQPKPAIKQAICARKPA